MTCIKQTHLLGDRVGAQAGVLAHSVFHLIARRDTICECLVLFPFAPHQLAAMEIEVLVQFRSATLQACLSYLKYNHPQTPVLLRL